MKHGDNVIESSVGLAKVQPQKNIEITNSAALDIDIVLRRADGSVKMKRTEAGHSFLGNFIKIFYGAAMKHNAPMVDGAAMTLRDMSNVLRTPEGLYWNQLITTGQDIFKCNAAANDSTYGIVVGTDDGSVYPKAIGNYKLGAQIVHGTGAGQLSHGNHAIVGSSSTATASVAGMTRTFSNQSAGSITVKEIGLASNMYMDTSTLRQFLIIRDILAAPIPVAAGESLTVSYRVKAVVVPATGGFLQSFVSQMARQWSQISDTCKDTAGQTVTGAQSYWPFWMTSMAGYGRTVSINSQGSYTVYADADERGIVIGSDASNVEPSQWGMITRIRSGETAGRMLYMGTAVYGCAIDAGANTASFKVEAMFKNVSGGAITVREVGIYAHGYIQADVWPNEQELCMARNLVAETVVADGETLRVTYTISIAT